MREPGVSGAPPAPPAGSLLLGYTPEMRHDAVLGPNPIEVRDPYDQSLVGLAPDHDAGFIESVIDGLERSRESWAATPAARRAAALKAWHGLILANADELAEIVTRENGKPIAEARAEVRYAASYVEWFAEEARRTYGQVIPQDDPAHQMLTLRVPVGLVAAITPWNFPLAMITRKVAPALAAGCPVILKPAEETPLSAIALQELARRAGIGPEIYSTVTSRNAPDVGEIFCRHSKIAKLTFTGSTRVGRMLMEQCAPSVKRVSLELGGNAPFIIFDDARIDAAIDGFIAAKFRNAGQTCVSPNRLIVHLELHQEVVSRLSARLASLSPGHGLDEGTDLGPLISRSSSRRIDSLVDEAVAAGARAIRPQLPIQDDAVVAPVLVDRVEMSMSIAREEIFGPVIPILGFASEAKAVEIANGTEYGLAAYLFTSDWGRARRVAAALEAGMIGINTGRISSAAAPFGGIKQSGLGREGGSQGIGEYLETKYVCASGE